MSIRKAGALIFFLLVGAVYAQQKQITLEEIYDGTFRMQYLDRLHSMNNGKEYAVLNTDRNTGTKTLDVYSYKTGDKVSTLINSSEIEGLDYFIGYTLSDDESKVLLSTNLRSIYRRSSLGVYYVYDLKTKKLTKVADEAIQEPTFSPDASKVAYGQDNNLFVKNLMTGETTQVTTDGAKNKIINGITDWVYEEEFAFVRAFDWNADGTKLAYIRFDETEVPEFSMDVFGKELYPSQDVFKYPKAGETNATVSLHIYNLEDQKTKEVDLSGFQNYYIPRLEWTPDADVLAVQTTNRKQNDVNLLFVDGASAKAKLILSDTDDAYVDITDNLTFLDDNEFLWTSEKDGWNHIYHYNKDGKLINQVTKGPWEVTSYYGYDPKTKRVFYQSSENGSINRGVYAVKLNGSGKKALSADAGTNSANFSTDFTYYINSFSDASTPYVFTLHSAKDGKLIRKIKDNQALKDQFSDYIISEKEFFTLPINGEELNAWMLKPKDFDSSKKYPVFMTQYSGPGSQSVANSWGGGNDYWFQMLAQDGYIIVCVDPRGTGLKGRDFKKMTQNELGKYEVEDQIAAAQKLGERPYIDADRIGIWGWSYGGFMASNAIFQGADTFKMAIAVAPVTSWRFYDSIYTERYMTTPQENASGYDENSPISHVDKLKGKYLLVHGSADDNVHVQNTMRLIEALVQANKQFDWAIYPDKNHGIYGGNTRLHLYTKMTNFIKENL
ncbi:MULTISPECIES: S9 family peptidase [unclassified Leeuwenhoekiella]|uniref:S9 family peptidase n=1 Tax=unclassified Leeuwenhoekiella TaxID=2615029 RepID=UPI000C5E37EE|nr:MULTISPECIES: S9 family peptidase [unclassified Leeuwenhoekiella]MAW97173.1 S9 family peptidase [Leeuwenhoekiella sp.]MBA82741.1 S9 family peptidase [Leeuwenhoekiella sp.]|tara:strand:- start:53820 stop:55991 length:2172 start_codon:yes stop_codon:yes gene_type:complete